MFAIRFESFTQMFLYVFIGYFIHMFFVSPYKGSSTRYQKFMELYNQVLEKDIEHNKSLYTKLLYGVCAIYLLSFYHTCKIILLSNFSEIKKEFIKSYLSPIKFNNDVYLQPCYIDNTIYYIPIKYSSKVNGIDIISITVDYKEEKTMNVEEYVKNMVTPKTLPVSLSSISPKDFGAEYITINYLSDNGIETKTFGSNDEVVLN